MGALLLPSRLRQQPQQCAQLDRSNRFAANALAIVSAAQDINYATGKQLVRGGTGFAGTVRPAGRAWAFRKNFYLQTEVQPAIGTQSFVEFWWGYLTSDAGNKGNGGNDPTFLTGSSANNTAIVGRIGTSRGSNNWGALYNWTGNTANPDFNNAGETLPVDTLTLLVVVRRQTGMEFWRDGKQVAYFAQGPANLAASAFMLGTFVTDAYWTSSSDAVLAGRVLTPVEPSAAEIRSFFENPWAQFQAPRDRAALAAISAFAAPVADTSLAGSGTAAASASGGLSTAVRLAGGAAAVASATGALATSVRLAGSGAATASAAAALSTAIPLSGAATATASASGSLAGSAAGLSGAAVSTASGTGTLSTGIRLAGTAVTASTGTGALATAVQLAGAATATASGAAALSTRLALAGSAAAVATAVAKLADGAPPMFDISKIHPSRIAVFDGSGSRVAVFEGSGSRVSRFQ